MPRETHTTVIRKLRMKIRYHPPPNPACRRQTLDDCWHGVLASMGGTGPPTDLPRGSASLRGVW